MDILKIPREMESSTLQANAPIWYKIQKGRLCPLLQRGGMWRSWNSRCGTREPRPFKRGPAGKERRNIFSNARNKIQIGMTLCVRPGPPLVLRVLYFSFCLSGAYVGDMEDEARVIEDGCIEMWRGWMGKNSGSLSVVTFLLAF